MLFLLCCSEVHSTWLITSDSASIYCLILCLLYRVGKQFIFIKVSGSGMPSGNKLINSHVKISMISLILSLSFRLYLNSLVYHRNIFASSSKVFGNLRKSSDIFGKFSEILGKCSGTFVWPSSCHGEHKIHIFWPPCNILYISSRKQIFKNCYVQAWQELPC